MTVDVLALLQVILVLCGIAALIYLIYFLVRAAYLLKTVQGLLNESRQPLSSAINHAEALLKNADTMSELWASEMYTVKEALGNHYNAAARHEDRFGRQGWDAVPWNDLLKAAVWIGKYLKEKLK
ncbi:hypothetical protein [Ferviditalea candida]|uniref:Uncharacterized protein n=1 Tax=Ferviditalea candida TaxID=3108399 RepID=A0ABU5ZK89_9BACL|nr:hypothetical protein [Paenibacillaceae bacterium T2]